MSLLVASIAAAGATVAAGALLLRAWWARRVRTPELQARAAAPRPLRVEGAEPMSSAVGASTASSLWLGLGDVVQLEDESLWLCGGAIVREAGVARAGIWWPGPTPNGTLVVELPAPERRVYLLRVEQTPLPPGSPTRLELGGTLMERRRSFPAQLERLRGAPPQLGDQAVISLYGSASGEVAVVVQTSLGNLVASGRAFSPGEVDRLGHADPDAEVGVQAAAALEPPRA